VSQPLVPYIALMQSSGRLSQCNSLESANLAPILEERRRRFASDYAPSYAAYSLTIGIDRGKSKEQQWTTFTIVPSRHYRTRCSTNAHLFKLLTVHYGWILRSRFEIVNIQEDRNLFDQNKDEDAFNRVISMIFMRDSSANVDRE